MEVASARTAVFAGGAPRNTFAHGRDLVDHTMRAITTPNNDTLYSSAHVELSKGPVTLTVPPSGARYVSLALMDAYTNNFCILGTRTTGPDGGRYTLVGPREAAEGPNVIRAPTNRVWALARILVDGPHDLEAARAVQAGFLMQGPAPDPEGPYANRDAPWAEYFASAAQLLARNPPPIADTAMLAAMAPLGLEAFDPTRFSPEEAEAIAAGVERGRTAGRRSGLRRPTFVQGWTYPYARLGDFGQEYDYRAAVAINGLAALPPEEAMYMRAQGDLPRALCDGAANWRLRFPADRLLPVNSFWSLTLYEATDDGQFFFADNEIGRYAIGDRTPGLTYDPDGSLDIWIGHDRPDDARFGNWLPAPRGPFALFLRAYLPKPELLHGAYLLPPLERLEN
ncbi:MAG: DUF1254 domain-containing protein [Phenylobacterium sp.]|nr:DUF1254 domain-containing protein [Phenylobacterium sp.]